MDETKTRWTRIIYVKGWYKEKFRPYFGSRDEVRKVIREAVSEFFEETGKDGKYLEVASEKEFGEAYSIAQKKRPSIIISGGLDSRRLDAGGITYFTGDGKGLIPLYMVILLEGIYQHVVAAEKEIRKYRLEVTGEKRKKLGKLGLKIAVKHELYHYFSRSKEHFYHGVEPRIMDPLLVRSILRFYIRGEEARFSEEELSNLKSTTYE